MSDETTHQHRRRRWPWLLLICALVVGGGALATQRFLSHDDVFASPGSVELPEPPNAKTPTIVYMQGPAGQQISQFATAGALVLDRDADVSTCRRALAVLDAIGTPEQMFLAASSVPDSATADIAVNHVAAMTRFLGSCLEQRSLPSRDEVRFTSTMLDRRLKQLR